MIIVLFLASTRIGLRASMVQKHSVFLILNMSFVRAPVLKPPVLPISPVWPAWSAPREITSSLGNKDCVTRLGHHVRRQGWYSTQLRKVIYNVCLSLGVQKGFLELLYTYRFAYGDRYVLGLQGSGQFATFHRNAQKKEF